VVFEVSVHRVPLFFVVAALAKQVGNFSGPSADRAQYLVDTPAVVAIERPFRSVKVTVLVPHSGNYTSHT
jgi:hypothetical protein